jgi:hypothetical protein
LLLFKSLDYKLYLHTRSRSDLEKLGGKSASVEYKAAAADQKKTLLIGKFGVDRRDRIRPSPEQHRLMGAYFGVNCYGQHDEVSNDAIELQNETMQH